jgi:hypothetical protein
MTNMHPEILHMLHRERERQLVAALERRRIAQAAGPRERRVRRAALGWIGRLASRRGRTASPCPDPTDIASQARMI